jgi:hypothetical protein
VRVRDGAQRTLPARKVDVLEQPLAPAAESVQLAPHEACFLRIDG